MIPEIGQLAQVACLLEATARKPGNVHRFRDFDDVTYLDFVLSSAAIVPAMSQARETPLGLTIFRAVEATRRVVATNTNLGMILLLAPMAAVPIGQDLREGVAQILVQTTVEDAVLTYQAIRLAMPGGLGKSSDQDIADEPTINLRETMRLAADRDLVARQYAVDFLDVFDRVLPRIIASIARGWSVETSIIDAYLDFLAHRPDTLIARKRGEATAVEASRRASQVLELGWPETSEGLLDIEQFDDWLRQDGHARNPGATADLITAALFAALRDGTIKLPLVGGQWSVVSENGHLSD